MHISVDTEKKDLEVIFFVEILFVNCEKVKENNLLPRCHFYHLNRPSKIMFHVDFINFLYLFLRITNDIARRQTDPKFSTVIYLITHI